MEQLALTHGQSVMPAAISAGVYKASAHRPARDHEQARRPPSRPGHSAPGLERNLAVAEAARAQPGQWVDLASGLTRPQTHHKRAMVLNRPSVAFQPAGSFETPTEPCDDGSFLVQVRYVGQPCEGGPAR